MITDKEKAEVKKNAKGLAKWFKIEITISIFDTVIAHWIFPPQKDE